MNHAKHGGAEGARSSRLRAGLQGTLLALATLGVVGCSSLPTNLAADGTIRVERQNSPPANIGLVRVGAVTEGLRISGTLDKTFMRRGRIPGHLHVETLTADGSVLSHDVAQYHRHRAKSGRAHFSKALTVQSEVVRSVRVVHHALGDQCS